MDLQKDRLDNLQQQIEKLQGCGHPKKEIRSKGPHFCWQCTRCGVVVGQWIPHSQVIQKDQIKPFDDSIYERFRATSRELIIEIEKIKKGIESQDWNDWYYKTYLPSREWRAKSHAVLRRCNYICEGCGTNKAILAHHLAYTNVGNEFLFELVGLCQDCHDSIHSKKN